MEYSVDTQPTINSPKKRITKRALFIWIGSFVLLVGAVILTVYIIHRVQTIDVVQSALKKSASVMDKANGENGYPQTLPAGATTNKDVLIKGGGSFDGTSYCIVGTSNNDKSIVFHINSGDKQPQGGVCLLTSVTTKPGSVTGIDTTVISAGQLGYTWNSVNGGLSYTLQCATDKDFNNVVSSSMKTSTTRDCNNLKDGTNYFVRIRANNAAGAGPWSSVLNATTSKLSISPTEPVLKALSSTSIGYSWGSVANAQSYIVEWATDINFMKDVKSVASTNLSGTASGLNPDTRYFFHVKAVTADFDANHAAFSPLVYISTLKA